MRLIDSSELRVRLADRYDKLRNDAEFLEQPTLYVLAAAFTHVDYEIEYTPTFDAGPVRHGKWFLLDECSNAGVYCNVCSKKVFKEDAWYANVHLKSKYCPNCGAKMDGDKNDNT